jgi:menaquinone-dependent protoporphyrinogen IX oxidase/NAD-dependent dihydropyrimidine dehydrogenase PreA subunit
MKSLLIYYSQSGNTKKIAEAIYAGMNQTGEPCDIKRLREVHRQDLAGYDLIGLGSPVINLKELSNVTSFIEDTMKNVDGKHGFAFCTHGALPGKYLSRVVPAMIQRGLVVIGWNDWFCSAVYGAIPKPYFTDGHPDEIDLREAEDFGREMVERSRRIYQGETQLIPTFPKGREYDEIYNPPEVEVPSRSKELRPYEKAVLKANARMGLKVNMEKCRYPKCTLCIDNCPNHSIDFSVSPPVFNIKCDCCWLCEQTCPSGAIEANWEPVQAAHDPLTIGVIQKALEIFEARGRFRRLVPLEDIGWDTPFWKTKKPPRFKIA